MNDKWVKRWLVESSSGNGSHIVAVDRDGNWGCDCVGWTRHVPRRDCRHITEVKSGGGTKLSDAIIERLR